MFYYSSTNKYHATNKIQKQMDLVTSSHDKWRISLNTNKTVVILFVDRLADDVQEINVHRNIIQWQTSVKYLGVHFDRSFKFHRHVITTCTRARQIKWPPPFFYGIGNTPPPLGIAYANTSGLGRHRLFKK